MAIRTSTTIVQEHLGNNYDSDTPAGDMTRFITSANTLTDRVVTCATARGMTHTTAELLAIETFIACYYYALHDPPYMSKSTGGASGSFQRATDYMDEAIRMDWTGCLASLNPETGSGTRARVAWLGKRPSVQTDYIDRD